MPGNLGCAVAVLAAITMLAPSLAALRAMALPMPLLAPVMNNVWPANFLKIKRFLSEILRHTTYLHFFFVVDTVANLSHFFTNMFLKTTDLTKKTICIHIYQVESKIWNFKYVVHACL